MKLTARIRYWEPGVGCFCPERVSIALHATFPQAEVDEETDLAEEEFAQVEAFLSSESSADPATRETMLKQARTKKERVGPVHRFRIPPHVTGVLRRYSVEFELAEEDPQLAAAVERFLRSLRLGEVHAEREP